MKSGFMEFVVTRMIPDSPGQTSRWYAYEYLQLVGDDVSHAKNPEESLANTLDKLVRDGRVPQVRRERIGGVYHYFPIAVSPDTSKEDIVVQISLPAQELEDISNLIAVGKFKSKNNAIEWLVTEGIKANRNYLNKVADVRKQIEQMKKEIGTT